MSRRHGLSDWESTMEVTHNEPSHQPAPPPDSHERSTVRLPENSRAKTHHHREKGPSSLWLRPTPNGRRRSRRRSQKVSVGTRSDPMDSWRRRRRDWRFPTCWAQSENNQSARCPAFLYFQALDLILGHRRSGRHRRWPPQNEPCSRVPPCSPGGGGLASADHTRRSMVGRLASTARNR